MIDDLSAAALALHWSELEPEARSRQKLLLLANLCVAVAGVPNVKLPKPPAGGHHALFGGGYTARASDAAGYNAAVMHARTQDDFHPVGNLHLGTVIIPALLAAAPADFPGPRLLEAMATGYMVTVALSRPGSVITTPKGLRSTGLYTPFGATAAVGRVRGLDQDAMASALAITASLACGLTQCWADGSDEWQLHVAVGAESGLRACDLAQHGFVGGRHALDGKAGFFNAMLGQQIAYADVAADLRGGSAIVETIMKRYPVSGICQPLTYVCERMARQHEIRSDRIAAIRIAMNPFEMRYTGTLNKGPFRSFSDVLMSAACCAGAVLQRGWLQFEDLMRRDDAARARLIAVTEVVEDPSLPLMSARLQVTMQDGEVITDEVRNAGSEVGIGWDDIDAWGAALWGDRAGYARCREVVDGLEHGTAGDLAATFGK